MENHPDEGDDRMDRIKANVEKYRALMFEAERFVWEHPETGYKEEVTGKYMEEKLLIVVNHTKKNNKSLVEITIHEGRNHQVRKMFEALGYPVLKLKRESVAFLTLDGVKPGSYRELSIKEVKKLYGEKNNQD